MYTVVHIMCMLIHMSLPFRPVPDSDLDDLRRRIDGTRAPNLPPDTGWTRGTASAALVGLLGEWRDGASWRRAEARILDLPWTETAGIRMLHAPASEPGAPTVVLLHGWPDSVLRFERVLPLLAGVNVVVPALPGFPFAPPVTSAGTTAVTMADAIAHAVAALGYERWVVSAGDVGGDVAEHLAHRHPERVSALHLTNVSPLHAVFADRSGLGAEELDYLDVVARWSRAEGGYIAEQSSKPHTLAAGLADSPAGLAAWILEKLHGWAHEPFDRDTLIAWIGAYWFTNTIGSSFATYANLAPPVDFVDTPTVLSTFAHDTKPAPLAFARRFVDVREHLQHDRGGHFAAWEVPELYATDLRSAIELGDATAR